MKTINFLSLALFALLLSSCDEVELVQGEGNPPPEGSRRAMIMDFTGHLCAGCPGAAKEANEIAEAFPDHVVVLAVHPDILSLTPPLEGGPDDPFTTDWRTTEGNNYQSIYDVLDAIPLGVVSGSEENGNYWSQTNSWRPQVESLIFQDRSATVDFTVDYNQSNRNMQISTSVNFQMDLQGDYNLILATVENNIVDWQKNGSSGSPADPDFPGGNIPDYVHKHVLRNHINGLTGDPIVSGGVSEGEEFTFSHSSTLSEDFVAEEVSIYAYIYNTSTLEIFDVVEHHIIE